QCRGHSRGGRSSSISRATGRSKSYDLGKGRAFSGAGFDEMNVLITKLGATGDVVRTTPLLRAFKAQVTWLTESKNTVLLNSLTDDLNCLAWEHREKIRNIEYDLIINLEDSIEVAGFGGALKFDRLFGAYLDRAGRLTYTEDSAPWFDLSLISSFGREKAD